MTNKQPKKDTYLNICFKFWWAENRCPPYILLNLSCPGSAYRTRIGRGGFRPGWDLPNITI